MKTLEIKTPAKFPQEIRRRMNERFLNALKNGFWYCDDCERPTERIEDDHGQPAKCGHAHCGSSRITYHRPLPA